MEAYDISFFSLTAILALMIIPFAIDRFLKLGITFKSILSVFRMVIQLFIIGVVLKYIFLWDNILITLIWVFIMIGVAAISILKGTSLKLKVFAVPVTLSLVIANIFVLIYFNIVVAGYGDIFDARYTIVILGMLLGNSLKGNIVGIEGFYSDIKRNENRYLYTLSMGAGVYEAALPYLKKNLLSTINPTLATMATVGIVSLPGMMTGQILGGSDPMVAIKYQIAIMISIFVSSVVSICLAVYFTSLKAFDKYGILRNNLFISNKK